MKKSVKVGQRVYIDSSFHISHGSDDVVGGLATVTKVSKSISGGEKCTFIEVAEVPERGYNWDQFLASEQEKLKKEFGRKKAHPAPDIDTPWIEDGDTVNGKVYHGYPIW